MATNELEGQAQPKAFDVAAVEEKIFYLPVVLSLGECALAKAVSLVQAVAEFSHGVNASEDSGEEIHLLCEPRQQMLPDTGAERLSGKKIDSDDRASTVAQGEMGRQTFITEHHKVNEQTLAVIPDGLQGIEGRTSLSKSSVKASEVQIESSQPIRLEPIVKSAADET